MRPGGGSLWGRSCSAATEMIYLSVMFGGPARGPWSARWSPPSWCTGLISPKSLRPERAILSSPLTEVAVVADFRFLLPASRPAARLRVLSLPAVRAAPADTLLAQMERLG
jgi:hypothetical protein